MNIEIKQEEQELFLMRLRYREGRLLDVGSNRPIPLTDSGVFYIVFRGAVDVFRVMTRDGKPTAPRKFLFRAGVGEALFALSSLEGQEEVHLVAVGHADTQVICIPQVRWEKLFQEEGFKVQMVSMWDGWFAHLWERTARVLPPRDCQRLSVGEQNLVAGQPLRSDSGVLWVQREHPPMRLFANFALPSEPVTAFPVVGAAWLEVVEACSILVQDTNTYLRASPPLWEDMKACHGLICTVLFQQAREESVQTQTRWSVTQQADALEEEQGAFLLASVLNPEMARESVFIEDTSLLYRACKLVGKELGISVVCPAGLEEIPKVQQAMEALSHASRMRFRLVSLEGDWWRYDCGALVAFRKEDSVPVALLFERGKYVMFDIQKGTRTVVSEAVVESLALEAYSLYRLFPSEPVRGRALLKFAMLGSGRDMLSTFGFGAMGGLLALLAPIWIGVLIDRVVPSGDGSQLRWIVLGLVVAAIAAGLVQLVQNLSLLRFETRADFFLQAAMLDRLLSLPASFFRTYSTGDLATRVLGINSLRTLLSGSVIQALLGTLFSLFSLGILLSYGQSLAVVALGLTATTLGILVLFSVKQASYMRPLLLMQGGIIGLVMQLLSGIAKIRVVGAEARAFRVWAESYRLQRQALFQARRWGNLLQVFLSGWLPLAMMLLFAAILRVRTAHFSTGAFLTYNAAFGQFLFSAIGLTSAINAVLQAAPYYELARPLLETPPESTATSLAPGEMTGHIRLDKVRFRYAPDAPMVLNDVTLSAEPGEFIAIVGPSGAGKSSLLRILIGLDVPESGAIFYDGADLATLEISAVRRQMGIVLQSSKLMTGNIFLNIVGASALTIEDAWDAARMVGLEEDIRRMPMGMYTVVSEGGSTFSGGQRQRLMIARAIAHRPRIVLFDEATSALDNRTQSIVTRSLEQLQATRIVIAHRLSTIEKADRIYVMSAGRVVQVGTYQELLKQPGIFAELARRQLS